VTSATKKRKQIDLPIAQFIAIIVLSISIFLIIDFGRRAATGYRVRREEEKLYAQLEAARQTQQDLLAKRDYVETDIYIEEVARNELKWSRADETIVVIMATPQASTSSSAPIKTPLPNQPAETPLQAWLALFFPD
jgi:cell division protein FtsB